MAAASMEDPIAEAGEALGELRLKGCLEREPSTRERLAQQLFERLHPAMAVLGLLFLVLVLAQSAAQQETTLHTTLLVATWVLWAVFAAEYLLRLAIAPSRTSFLRRTWWQAALLAVPFLAMVRAVFILRAARATRVAAAAIRGGRSAKASLSGRAGWLGVLTVIVAMGAADVLYRAGAVRPYGAALHAAAMATISGAPIPSDSGLAQVLGVVLAVYAVAFFATLAGILGAFFLETKEEKRHVGGVGSSSPGTGAATRGGSS